MTHPSRPRSQTRPLIVLVNSLSHEYREYLLRSVAEAARVWLLLDREPTWETPYIEGYTVVDTLDPAAMIEAVGRMGSPPAGVLCWDEVRMRQTAELAAALGLPGGDPEAVGRCRDKHQTRLALAAAGVPQAESALVSSIEEARAAADRIGYPLVLKPRALGASFGVNGVSGADGLEAGYAEARGATEDGVPYYEAGVLVEEYLEGPEISVETACAAGTTTPLFVARKVSGYPPYFEEVGHHVDGDDPLLRDPQLLDVLDRAHKAVGFVDGVTHTELRLTSDGPKVIEINCRLGGDFIPYLGRKATGIDPGRVAVDIASGRRPEIVQTHSRVAAVQFFYPERDLTVGEVTVDRDAMSSSVDMVRVLATPGQRLVLPPGGHVTSRHAVAVAVDDTLDACRAALHRAAAGITLRAADEGPSSEEAGVGYAPGIAEFIERSNEAIPLDFYTLPLDEQRSLYTGLKDVFPFEMPTGVTVTEEEVDGHRLRLYRPEKPRGSGLICYIRAGGFVVGSLDTHHSVVAELADKSGVLAAALDFRLAPEHPFPASLEDCYGALSALIANADRFGFDPDRVVVAGESSGGNMAVSVCMMARDRGGPAIRGHALISPVLDFSRWRTGGVDAPLLTGGEMEYYTACYCPDPQTTEHPYVSPLIHGTFHDLPPAYVMGTELDSLLVDSRSYADRLAEHRVPATLTVEPGLVHSSIRARGLSPRAADAWSRFCVAAARLTEGGPS
jgi:acetyl esterase/lipase/biotin carboxylase